GTMIVKMGINVAKEKFNCDRIVIEAQTYARSLYEKCGFVQSSEEFLEDGIPHIQMIYKIKGAES
ncbi:MAG: GNAT family N-acetyltransferase, partial [Solobacterium sp.]|nr:GNAT family N-acetyltransferase [Solobacterium sp.]